jgi:predicted nucleic acid-binding protein
MYYVEKYDIKLITTGDILKLATEEGFITKVEGNEIWKNMIHHKRKLPTATFSEYLSFKA